MATQAGDHTGSCRMDLTTSVAAALLARAFVRRQLTSWDMAGPLVSDAVGCVSELVTLTLAHSAGLLRVELLDGEQYVMVASRAAVRPWSELPAAQTTSGSSC